MRPFLSGEKPPPVAEQVTLLRALVKSRALRQSIEARGAEVADLFGDHWKGSDSDWRLLRQMAQSAVAIRQLIVRQSLDLSAAQRLATPDARTDLLRISAELVTLIEKTKAAWASWLSCILSDQTQWLREDIAKIDLRGLIERLSPLPERLEELQDWVDLKLSIKECCAGALTPFVKWALGEGGRPARGKLAAVFKRHFYRLLVEAIVAQRPALQSFRGEDHQSLIERFRVLDLGWLGASRHRLATLVSANRPDVHYNAQRSSKLGILQAEIRKKARHMPLRKLLSAVGDVVQSVKPCFMMSPISVAQYLVPGGLEFDVVIFDEASQVEPADAYGAIARGRQLILVGDEKQLPPTNFFSKVDSDESAAEDETFKAGDLESILSVGIVQFPKERQCSLRWHYRSRHASLIDFSNQKFYDGYTADTYGVHSQWPILGWHPIWSHPKPPRSLLRSSSNPTLITGSWLSN